MKLFMIRWPNGTTSLVGAPTKDEAMVFADCEWDDPFDAELTELKRFAMDLQPKEAEGEFFMEATVGPFGGADEFEPVLRKAYPLVLSVLDGPEAEDDDPERSRKIRDAIAEELNRVDGGRLPENASQSVRGALMGWAPGSPIGAYYDRYDRMTRRPSVRVGPDRDQSNSQ